MITKTLKKALIEKKKKKFNQEESWLWSWFCKLASYSVCEMGGGGGRGRPL